jgi:hypothetical protein
MGYTYPAGTGLCSFLLLGKSDGRVWVIDTRSNSFMMQVSVGLSNVPVTRIETGRMRMTFCYGTSSTSDYTVSTKLSSWPMPSDAYVIQFIL